MKFDLASIVRRPSKRPITLPPIITTKAQADDLAAIYMHVVRGWQEATPGIVAAYEVELARVLQTDAPDALGAAIDGAGAQIQRLVLMLTPSLRDWALRVETWHEGKFERGVLAGSGVDLSAMIGPGEVQDTVETVIARNVALVKDVSAQAQARISDAVFRGLQQRTLPREVAKEIREATGMARSRSIRIAQDQAVKLASALDAERQRQAGLDHWKWKHSGKLHPRLEHKARDGNVYTDETAPKDLPGQLPFCGCVRQGIIVFDDEPVTTAQPPAPVAPA